MPANKYDKFFIQNPKISDWEPYHGDPRPKDGEPGNQRHVIYINNELVKMSSTHVMINWIDPQMRAERRNDPERPSVFQHTHPYDEILLFIGNTPKDLGAVIEMEIGPEREKHLIDKQTAVFIPKGLKHCPLTWKKLEKPHVLVAISLADEY